MCFVMQILLKLLSPEVFVVHNEVKTKVGETDEKGSIMLDLKEMCQNVIVFENGPVYR